MFQFVLKLYNIGAMFDCFGQTIPDLNSTYGNAHVFSGGGCTVLL